MAQRRVLALLAALVALTAGAAFGASAVSAQSTVTLPVGDIWFCSDAYEGGVCDTEIVAGDTVVWDFSGAILPHTTTECGSSCDAPTGSPLWNSGVISGGGTFSFTFDEPGVYLYYCQVHPELQRGRIIVLEDATPLPPVDLAPPATTTPGVALPPSGHGPDAGTGDWVLSAAAGGFALAGVTALALARARRNV